MNNSAIVIGLAILPKVRKPVGGLTDSSTSSIVNSEVFDRLPPV